MRKTMLKNKLIKSLVLAATILLSSNAHANDNYILLDLGGAFVSELDMENYGGQLPKSSLYYSIGIGSRVNNYFLVDVTINRMEDAKFSKPVTLRTLSTPPAGSNLHVAQSFTSTMLMFNGTAAYDVGKLSPYVTLGLGTTYNQAKDYVVAGNFVVKGADQLKFAWDIGFGGDYKINDTITTNIGYRYFDLSNATTSTTLTNSAGTSVFTPAVTTKLEVHVISAGVKFLF